MPPAPSTQPWIRFLVDSTYKGGVKRWSTRFYLAPAANPTNAQFDGIETAVRGSITGSLTERSTYKGAECGYAGSDIPVHSISASVTGTFVPSPELGTPLECCALIRYATTQRSTKNHPIYLYNYWHDVCIQSPLGDREQLQVNQKANLEGFAQQFVAGISTGGVTFFKAGPRGAVAQSRIVEAMLTHRDFPV